MRDVFASRCRACSPLNDLTAKVHTRVRESIAIKPVEDRRDEIKVFVFLDAMKFYANCSAMLFAAADNCACKPKQV
jgi:hypothetical protein